ncbi:hypothetical protein OYC64_016282 [Pagothenia borchgrevinki]|uniref:Uncharacterized protein n=1 Tax=Pagothenia borchgrevinki TaxID=8213 RepID=A0ABD2HK90_PAGBO
MEPPSEGTDGGQGPNGLPSIQPDNHTSIPPEDVMIESPDRPYPDDLHDNRHNPQTVEMREMGRDGYSDTEPYHPMDGHGRTLSMPRLSADNQVSTFIPPPPTRPPPHPPIIIIILHHYPC